MDDGEQVNIPVLDFFVKFLNRFGIGGMPKGITKEKFMDCNEEKFMNPRESAESESQWKVWEIERVEQYQELALVL